MEDLVAAMNMLAASVEAMKTTVDCSQRILKEFVGGCGSDTMPPTEVRSDITALGQQLRRAALNLITGFDPAALQAHATPADLEGGEVATGRNGDEGRGPGGRGCNNATSTPNGAVPAKCSTVGFGFYIGKKMDTKLVGVRDSDTGSLDHAASGKSLMVNSSPTVGGMEVVASSLFSVDPAIETGKQDARLYQHGMVTQSTLSAPPWAPHIAKELDANRVEDSSDFNTTFPTKCSTCLLSVPSHPPKPSSTSTIHVPLVAPSTTSPTIRSITMPWGPSVQLIMPWLNSCVSYQVNMFERIWQQINKAIMISSEPNALPCGTSTDISSFHKHKYAYTHRDGKFT